MAAKYFGCHYGNIDNIAWLASRNFNEVGYVIGYGASIPSPADIKNRGMFATLNCINGGEGQGPTQMNVDGAQFEPYFQSIVAAGWDMIAGEGCTNSVITSIEKYCWYVNYGGDQANDMYIGPWNHPHSNKHLDYIESYTAGNCVNNPGGVGSCIQSAKSAGALHSGILIGDWCLGLGGQSGTPVQTYINLVDNNGCDSICFWGGYGQSSSRMQALADQLIGHYGAAKWGGVPTPGPGPGPTPVPGPENARPFHYFSDVDVTAYLTKAHNGQVTKGRHTIAVFLQSGSGNVNITLKPREFQPGHE